MSCVPGKAASEPENTRRVLAAVWRAIDGGLPASEADVAALRNLELTFAGLDPVSDRSAVDAYAMTIRSFSERLGVPVRS